MKRKKLDLRGLMTTLLLCFVLTAVGQTTVTGLVKDETGEPLIGATVQEKGNTINGTPTDIDGQFTLKVKSSKAVLIVSYVGMETTEVPLNGRTDIEIVMKENSEILDEVVVVGYGTQKKSDITGS
ncbi:MAG: carboxypeptidase-like regulatory domain-containing protein, partial [Muribaculaceae bacterium]|nr:carboxypeptidase-like regulatory domain-containing protein [Muribaculaceae bacterium]